MRLSLFKSGVFLLVLLQCSQAYPGNVKNTSCWIQYGRPRTATTLQYAILCFAKALLLDDLGRANELTCSYHSEAASLGQSVIKMHSPPNIEVYPPEKCVVFTTSQGKDVSELRRKGYQVVYIQDVETVKKLGTEIVYSYQEVLGLNGEQEMQLVEHLRFWDILRMCCGEQMSADFRNALHPRKGYHPHYSANSPLRPACTLYNITAVQEHLESTQISMKFANLISSSGKELSFTSDPDPVRRKTYCERYNKFIQNTGAKFNQGMDLDYMYVELGQ